MRWSRTLTVGFEYFTYNNELNVDKVKGKYKPDRVFDLGNYIVKPDKFALFARYDSYEPNTVVDNDKMRLIIAGFDWAPWGPNVRIQPNIWFYRLHRDGEKDDIYFALTFFMSILSK